MNEKQFNEEIAIRLLGGIDSYYFFIDTSCLNEQLYHFKYEKYIKYNELDCNSEFLGYSGKNSGFVGSWFRIDYQKDDFVLPVFKIGFKDPTKQKNVNNIYIQLLGAGIYFFGFSGVLEYIRCWLIDFLAVDVTLKDFINSRVDVNCFIGGFDFSSITGEMFHSTFMRCDIVKTFSGANERLETLYLGSRSAKYSFKIYDKKKELLGHFDKFDMPKTIKLSFLFENGFSVDGEIWNAEFSLKREFLKEFKTYTASDLLKNYHTIYTYCFSKLRFLGYDLQKIKRYKDTNSLNKFKTFPLWQEVQNNQNFSVEIHKSDVEREVIKYNSNVENNAYKAISKIANRLILSGFAIDRDRFLNAAGL